MSRWTGCGGPPALPRAVGMRALILGGRDRLVTGELVPRRTRVEAQNLDTLARLVRAAALTAPVDRPEPAPRPVTIDLEPLRLDPVEECVLV